MKAEIRFKTNIKDVTEGHPAYMEERRRALIEALWYQPMSLDDLKIICREIEKRIQEISRGEKTVDDYPRVNL